MRLLHACKGCKDQIYDCRTLERSCVANRPLLPVTPPVVLEVVHIGGGSCVRCMRRSLLRG
jgi:hypothetical protein